MELYQNSAARTHLSHCFGWSNGAPQVHLQTLVYTPASSVSLGMVCCGIEQLPPHGAGEHPDGDNRMRDAMKFVDILLIGAGDVHGIEWMP